MFPYTPFYCEENIWHLAQSADCRGDDGQSRYVVFISNRSGHCALWNQRAAPSPTQPVVWDYHVVLLVRRGQWQVWDLDTRLEMPSAIEPYVQGTFPARLSVPTELRPAFRVIEAERFVREFASDRSHMRSPTGDWLEPPPPWPMIMRDGVTSNLAAFIDVTGEEVPGEVLDLAELRARFRSGD